jgi:capsular exopolysaccharide synthesis family protein
MSRIQDILSKAERDGTARRTRGLGEELPASPATAVALPRRETARSAPPVWTPPAAMPPHAADVEAPVSEHFPSAVALDHHLVAALAPQSLPAEQYRSLRTRIKLAEHGRGVRTLAVTSPAKGDGKSLTAANLALTMAQEYQQRVLLLDGDLRRPAVHQLFGIANTPGLADVLMGTADLNQALVALPEYHVTILPAGAPPGHPAELLGSSAMRRVFDALRTRFDRILIDLPPVAPLADVHIVAPMVDGVLMIVRAGVTPKPAIEQALSGLDASKVLGLVLNEAGDATPPGYAYEGYGYLAG